MASNATKAQIFGSITKYGIATQTAKKTNVHVSRSSEVKTAVLSNKLVVASVDGSSPISTVSVLFRAGSRYEQPDSLGITHALRIAAGLTTKDSTQFGIMRNLQQIGATLTCQTDRETIAYTLQSTRDSLETGLKFLGDVAAKQVFKPWEISDNIPRLKYELSTVSPFAQLLDLLHRAAYRRGLGNSLFCPDYLIGSHNTESLQHYVRSLFTTNRAAVVGVGVDHGDLLCFAQNLALESGTGPSDSTAKYTGGDARKDTADSLAHVAVAVEGASLKNTKEALAFAVLHHALGVGSHVKWGSSDSPLTRAAGSAAGNYPFAVTAFNANYTDSGLFGFVASSPASIAGKVVYAAVKQLRSGIVSPADIARGKVQLKAAILHDQESDYTLAEELGTQAVLLGSVLSGPALVSAVNSVTDAEVNAAASRVKAGKLSVAAVGSLSDVPYADELK